MEQRPISVTSMEGLIIWSLFFFRNVCPIFLIHFVRVTERVVTISH